MLRSPAAARLLILVVLIWPPSAETAQDLTPPPAAGDALTNLVFSFSGPPPPVAPEVIARDPATGRVTIRAGRGGNPICIDGRFDEALCAVQRRAGAVRLHSDRAAAGSPESETTEPSSLIE